MVLNINKKKGKIAGLPKIISYKGYGNNSEVFISGMVTEDKGIAKPHDKSKIWQNIMATIRRFASNEIAGVRVEAKFYNQTQITETDDNGFFGFTFPLDDSVDYGKKPWHTVHFTLLDEVVENQPDIYTTGEIRIISPEEKRIIVSDIDDTVMVSHSTQLFKKLRLMLMKNALTRSPFPGVKTLYQGLAQGDEAQHNYPFFYVSSSEWNLYDLLEDFFSFNHMPKGVFMLKELKYSIYKFWKSGGGNHEHKYDKIKKILNLYDNHKLILLGDSGQRDPEIYRNIALEYPGRVESIYIRKVRKRIFFDNVEDIQEQLADVGTTYMEADNSTQVAFDAVRKKYMPESFIERTEQSKGESNIGG